MIPPARAPYGGVSLSSLQHYRTLFQQFLWREIRNRYLGSVSGMVWLVLQPLAQLAVYGFVFSTIFRVRFPELGQHNFLIFVAAALWPWLAFSEAVQRAAVAVENNADLIRKVSLPSELLVSASVAAPFVVHGAGYLIVLAVMWLLGTPLDIRALPSLVLLWGVLAAFSLGLGLVLSAFQVFLRDMTHVLASIMMFWFYATPILYPRHLVPDALQPLISANPLSYFVERMRELVLFARVEVEPLDLLVVLLSLGFCYLGWWLFRRCAAHFEDFL